MPSAEAAGDVLTVTTPGGDATDEELARLAAAGDSRSLDTLLTRHRPQAYRVAFRITRRADDAEDAVQAAFVATWLHLNGFREEARFSTWLHRVVTNCAIAQVRARAHSDRQRDIGSLPPALHPRCTDRGPVLTCEDGAFGDDLRRAVGALSPDLRTCWVARDVDGLSYREVAALTGVCSDTVRGRIARARRRLAAELVAWR